MDKKTEDSNSSTIGILVLATTALFLEFSTFQHPAVTVLITILDFLVLFLFAGNLVGKFIRAEFKSVFLKKNIFELLFLLVFAGLFFYSKYVALLISINKLTKVSTKLIFILNVFIALKIFSRFKKLNYFLRKFSKNPAQTIIISFMMLILVGTLLLMMPFATADYTRLGFVNALFTATSAVCVTGLIVVDTAARFSLFGKTVILFLIQCGGLGIMLFSFFTAYMMGRQVSLEEKITLSYFLNEKDMRSISKAVMKIIAVALSIECAGALLLLSVFIHTAPTTYQAVFFSFFHAVSAFCNAGFALFTDSLELFKSNMYLNGVIALLVITGGLGFPVIVNVYEVLKDGIVTRLFKKKIIPRKITLNTRVVIIMTGLLIVGGWIIFYGFEHQRNLVQYNLATQYLGALFQSITLRTAGFNTLPMNNLHSSTYLVMITFMFIGAGSASTAGGVKVNTCAVIYAYIKSILNNLRSVVLFKQSLPRELVNRAFLIVFFGLAFIISGTIILTRTEQASLMSLLFEAVSAFGTVGLSTGITASLTFIGKLVIMTLMFLGRLGPLTIIASLSQLKSRDIEYPSGQITIG